MKRRAVWYCLSLGFMFVISGCASYYKVVDPDSNRVYYTDSIHKKGNGVIQFKDEATKTHVTLPQSEIMEITEDQFKANIHPR